MAKDWFFWLLSIFWNVKLLKELLKWSFDLTKRILDRFSQSKNHSIFMKRCIFPYGISLYFQFMYFVHTSIAFLRIIIWDLVNFSLVNVHFFIHPMGQSFYDLTSTHHVKGSTRCVKVKSYRNLIEVLWHIASKSTKGSRRNGNFFAFFDQNAENLDPQWHHGAQKAPIWL